MVRETPFVKPGDDVPNIGSSPQFESVIAPLNNVGDIGERVSTRRSPCRVVARRDPRVQECGVREQVLERVRAERATSQLDRPRATSRDSTRGDLKAAAERSDSNRRRTLQTRTRSAAGTSPCDSAIYALRRAR